MIAKEASGTGGLRNPANPQICRGAGPMPFDGSLLTRASDRLRTLCEISYLSRNMSKSPFYLCNELFHRVLVKTIINVCARICAMYVWVRVRACVRACVHK